MEKIKIIQEANYNWEGHPRVKGAESMFLLTNQEENTEFTCMLTHLPVKTVVNIHFHEFDEIIYVIEGKAVMYIDGAGEIPMKKGSFFRIPKGVKHHPYDIEEDIIAYNVFYPFSK